MIYLNNASTSYPKPEKTIASVNEYLRSLPFHSLRAGFKMQTKDIIYDTREKIAELFNAPKAENIIFTSGATEALNLIIKGIELRKKHVISTNTEHNSVLRPLKTLEKANEIELTIVDCDENGLVAPNSIIPEIRENTKAIIINHCSNVTGTVQEIKAISQIAHKNNCLFIVDASQSAGSHIIDVQDTGIDILAFTGHKSLYGIQGIGGLYLNDKITLKPLKVGGTGVKSNYLYQPKTIPMYYEAGTPNIPGIVSLNAGLSFIKKTGMAKIKEVKEKHIRHIFEQFEKISGIILHSRRNWTEQILSFNIKNIAPTEVGYILEESFNILVRSGLHCAPLIHNAIKTYPLGTVRVSPSYFNTDKEINLFIESVKQIVSNLS